MSFQELWSLEKHYSTKQTPIMLPALCWNLPQVDSPPKEGALAMQDGISHTGPVDPMRQVTVPRSSVIAKTTSH